MRNTVLCRTLMGNGHIDFSIECLNSLIENSLHAIRLEIFEDGSLQIDDIVKIESSLKNTIVVPKKARDIIISKKLAIYKKSLEFRNCNVFSFKILDTMLYDSEDFFYVDSDVYFTQKFIFPGFEGYPIFMMDFMNGYVFKPLNFFSVDTSILPFINAGFMHYPNKLFRLDLVESLLEKYYSKSEMGHWWAEQTLWAFLGAQTIKSYFFDASQVVFSDHNLQLSNNTLCVHLVSPTRYQFNYVKRASFKFKSSNTHTQINIVEIKKDLSAIKYMSNWIYNKYKSVCRIVRLKVF